MKIRLLKRIAFLLALSTVAFAAAPDQQELAQRSRAAAKSLGGQLKERLQTAIQSDGVVGAITVCNVDAPRIAATVSQSDLTVGRTSLRARNPANAPDEWERRVLEQFEQRKARGASAAELEFYETVSEPSGAQFRYMKAIPTDGLCLVCHGSRLAPEVKKALDSLYPNDQARGFAVGDLRGAFTVRLSLTP